MGKRTRFQWPVSMAMLNYQRIGAMCIPKFHLGLRAKDGKKSSGMEGAIKVAFGVPVLNGEPAKEVLRVSQPSNSSRFAR